MCSTAHHRTNHHPRRDTAGGATIAHAARPSGSDHVRASDAERDALVEHLREQAAAGRLDVEELARRTDAALAAVTLGDLRALTADLPEPGLSAHGPTPRRASGRPPFAPAVSALGTYLAVSMMLVAIWALTGAGYFWPIWPILGWGLCALPRSRRAGCWVSDTSRRPTHGHGRAPISSV